LNFGARIHLSLAEKAALTFFTYISIAAVAFNIPGRELSIILILNAVTFAALLALRRNRERAPWIDAAADMFPVLLILVAYRESGLLLTPDPTHHLDYIFIQWDRGLLHIAAVQALLRAGTPGLQHYLEFAYLLCYPLVPLGLAAIHFAAPRTSLRSLAEARAHHAIAMDDYWATVLIATLFCYAVYPFFPLTPPRVLFNDVPGPPVDPLLRHWNFWLLDHYSVQACIFPSGHVAAATAVALAVRKHAPRLGNLFMLLAISVAFATVYGRYHYAADALAGMVVGVAAQRFSELLKQTRPKAESILTLAGAGRKNVQRGPGIDVRDLRPRRKGAATWNCR
jgi:membrane-associated phospholipid phosphatase